MIDCQSPKPSVVIVFSSLLTHFQHKIVHRNEEKTKLAPAYTVAMYTLSSFGYLGVKNYRKIKVAYRKNRAGEIRPRL